MARQSLVRSCVLAGTAFLVVGAGLAADRPPNDEIQERSRIAAANLEDAVVVDCQLPGKLQKLGGTRTYLTPGVLRRLSAVDCRARGGEYTLGDLSSGTLSLRRWMPLAEQGNAEAQYYVARIYANGMGGVESDYAQAAQWYQKAAQQEYGPAQQELGYLYEQGLGVQRDPTMALNLQRKAAGLGDELDYAWKIAAAKDEAAEQVAALSAQLSDSNLEIETLRTKLQATTDAAFRARAELQRSQLAVVDLREQLNSAAQSPADRERLARSEEALRAAQDQVVQLSAQLRNQQAELAVRTAQSQASNAELNELLANERDRNRSLEARLAQSEQRLTGAQQELSQRRDEYRTEVARLVAERDDLQRAAANAQDSGHTLVTARERELTLQALHVQSLEQELSRTRKALASGSATAQASEQAQQQLKDELAQLQTRYAQQQQQLRHQQDELASLKNKSATEQAAMLRDAMAQLDARSSELERKQRQIASLDAQTNALRAEVEQLRKQRSAQVADATSDAQRAREALQLAQSKITEQREKLDRLQTERATDAAELSKARDELRRQMADARRASDMQIGFLRQDLEARQKDIAAKDQEIERLQQRVDEQSRMFAQLSARAQSKDTMVAAAPAGSAASTRMRSIGISPSGAHTMLKIPPDLTPPSYHALIIANSNYRHIPPLETPANDAREIGQLLRDDYGFQVTVLFDQTSEQIMKALHEQTLTLTPRDSLLIYFAGHGDTDEARGRAYWLGVDADPVTRQGWIEADNIRAKIKQMQATQVLLVADSCFSGAITHPKTTTIDRALTENRLRLQWNRRARMVLTSGQVTPVSDSASDPRHSLFARHFIQILRQNVNVMSGEMLSYELAVRMRDEPVAVDERGEMQTPTYSVLQDANHDVGDFFFVPIGPSARVASLSW